MPRRTDLDDEDDFDPDDDAFDESNDGDEFDVADDDEMETVPCPYCRREIAEDSPRCPYCERYITAEDAPATRKPWWILLGVGLCLWAVYRWIAP